MAKIIYTYGDQVYANITNLCNCDCTFCIRKGHEGVGDAETLWHEKHPSKEEVLQAIRSFDFTGYEELVFCGYGEPTCALDILLDAAACAKKEKHLRIRLNTNGLGSAENKKDIVPELADVIDVVSISLNAPTKEEYNEVTRPRIPDAFDEMVRFAKRCDAAGIETVWTVVDVMSDDQIARSRALADNAGIRLRVREFT